MIIFATSQTAVVSFKAVGKKEQIYMEHLDDINTGMEKMIKTWTILYAVVGPLKLKLQKQCEIRLSRLLETAQYKSSL